MKVHTAFPVFIALLFVLTPGCKKGNNPQPKTTLLAKSITSSQTTTYQYDANNRAIRADVVFTNPVNNYSGIYTYNNSGQVMEVLYDAAGDDIKNVYSYNGNGQISKIETYTVSAGLATFNSKSEGVYTTPGKISVYETPYGGTPYLYVEYFLDAKGNIAKQQSYDQTGAVIVTTENSDFDNKPAPSLSIPKTGFARNVNNYGTVTVTPPAGNPSTSTYTYEYNNDGYPVKRTTNTGSIITYEYIKK
ncbi:hypothetical protein [Pedobacter insulae]|uniref:YD repeat-containing protein n=1 Tax=Pedobacter insulae TaxID=414048 RepID=A0A1I2Z7P6_9SPHI|nr:hypothetical protein [Pedobacter insulae]SFH33883.1 YD repeat-containing protein [Pedobacter insulae]